MANIRIRCSDETKTRWKRLCADIDPDASYEEVVQRITTYFDEDESRVAKASRAEKVPTEFR